MGGSTERGHFMKYTLKNATVLDGTENMKAQPDMTVWIDGERIVGIEANGSEMPGSEVIDLNGAYLMPGLINMHVHLPASGKAPKSDKPKDYKKLASTLLRFKLAQAIYIGLEEKLAKTELYSGVTTLRAVGGLRDFDGRIRDKIKEGKIEGPRILAANMAVSVPGGHFAGSLATETTSPETAREDVMEIASTKPDLIKLMITGGVMDSTEDGEPGALRMQPEIVRAACDEAHKHGLKVAAHVESTEGVRVALENGVDTVEHGAKVTPELVELFKKRNAALICTLSPALPYSLFDIDVSKCSEIGRRNGDIVFNGIIECAKTCLENGVAVGLGTDTGCPFITHYNTWRELHYFTKYLGVTPEQALFFATLGNARIAGIDNLTGSVEVGKCADLIVSRNNPLEQFSNLKELEYVFTCGRMIKNPKIKKNAAIDAELDKYM